MIACCCFIFVAKGKCPKMLVELNVVLCEMLESSVVSYINIIPVDCDNIKYEISSGILYPVILPR